ncbi:Pumilio/Puf RNA-binding domain-containing family protein [Abeliophyllum distichum]|uniref:Pumilio/Puf RNA-binding domain-containing family protein n=1 Tax=Abeliophyllum distichum TaxID=126358 RepID=A0ABD1SZ13_9LAMI
MDEGERKKYPSLPPNYVSLAQLKERWLQKQEEKEKEKDQLEKEEEIQRLAESQKQENENDRRNSDNYKDRKNGKKVRAPSVRFGHWQRLEKDEQKMRVIEGIVKDEEIKIGGSQGDGNMRGISKEKKTRKRYCSKKKFRAVEANGDRDTERVVIENEEKEIPGSGNSCNDVGFYGKIEKNDLDGAEIISGNEAVGMGILRGKNSVKEGFSGEFQGTDGNVNVCAVEVLVENGGREKIGRFGRKNWNRKGFRRGFQRSDKNESKEYKIKDSVEINKLKDSEELTSEKKEGERNEFHRLVPGEQSGNKNGFSDGFRRTDKNGRTSHKTKEKSIEIDELKGSEELVSEKEERGGNELMRNVKNRRRDYKIKDRGDEGEDLNGSGITPEKAADEVLVGESERNDVKGGVTNEFRRKENLMGKIGRKFGNLTINDGKAGNLAPRVEVYGGGQRRYGNFGRSGNWNMNQRHIGVWVKKQEISNANAAEIGTSDFRNVEGPVSLSQTIANFTPSLTSNSPRFYPQIHPIINHQFIGFHFEDFQVMVLETWGNMERDHISAVSTTKIMSIWEELGTKFKTLLEMGRPGVVASLLAASQRLQTHEHKCCQALAAAVRLENESTICIVPRILYFYSDFNSEENGK